MIEIKLRNPTTNLFEESSVGALTTPRKINGVDFDGTKDIIINENEVIVSDTTPMDPKNKLWISGVPGVSSPSLTIDWVNVNNKPLWTSYMPLLSLTGLANKFICIKPDETGYEYKDITVISNASEVTYNNIDYPTVESALNKLLYIPLTGTLSGGNVNEVGSTVSQVVLNWTYNKPVTTQSINNGIGSLLASLRTYTHSGQTITTNRTYTLTGSDGSTTINSSTTVSFSYKRYWGTSSTTTLTDANILALTREFSSSRVQNRVFDCTGSKYFWIIYPSSFGSAAFKVGGLSFSDMNLEVRTITNESGASVQLNIYRVNNIQTGSAINVEVS